MSSSEFETTYEHAAAIVRQQCGSASDVLRVLDSFRGRIRTKETDPLENRELIVEPQHEAQVLGVSTATVEEIVTQLRRLNIVHIWVRALCPSVDEPATIVETNAARVFRHSLGSSCPHCARSHEDLSWDSIETFYAFHFDTTPERFRLTQFLKRPTALPARNQELRPSRVDPARSWVASVFSRGPTTPIDTVFEALEANEPVAKLPTQKETLDSLWKRGLGLVLGGFAVCFVLHFYSHAWAAALGVALLFAFLVLAFVTHRAIYAAARTERRVFLGGYVIALALLASSTGVRFSAAPAKPTRSVSGKQQPQERRGQHQIDWSLSYGETDPNLVWACVVVFLGTNIVVVVMHVCRV